MTDQDSVERFARVIGLGVVRHRRRRDTVAGTKRKNEWTWRAYGWENTKLVYGLLRDGLGARRRAKFEEILAREPASAPEPCGHTVPDSHAGYQRHRRAGTIPCVDCRAAHTEATRRERAARLAA